LVSVVGNRVRTGRDKEISSGGFSSFWRLSIREPSINPYSNCLVGIRSFDCIDDAARRLSDRENDDKNDILSFEKIIKIRIFIIYIDILCGISDCFDRWTII